MENRTSKTENTLEPPLSGWCETVLSDDAVLANKMPKNNCDEGRRKICYQLSDTAGSLPQADQTEIDITIMDSIVAKSLTESTMNYDGL